ncbi:ATP-dependent zinc metalloprotease FtsH [Sedimentibacter sp.]|uniref:ATP-dependent zinc metalloprotease FtsH n=1 Tax=Sedimentibacter sp. TaxID=1960295 RepID=UPI0028A2C89C|nr:ATP-dependent zinc metalloprotease FtsH [Sedimentibacter sp.]
MKETQNTNKPFIYYYGIVLITILLLNSFVLPYINKSKLEVAEVDYGTFLSMVQSGDVTTVEVEEKQIAFLTKSETEKVYITSKMEDPYLVDRLLASGQEITFDRIFPKENSLFVNTLISWVLPLLFFIAIGQIMSRQLQKRMGSGAMQFGKSNAKIYVEAQTGKRFEDVAGQDEAKEALTEIVDFLHNPQKYEEIGASMPKGALLVGPPGTGKTLLAKAVAGEAKVPFFSISGSEFVEMFVGMGAAKVRDLFKQAQEKAPCIIFIDEIDTIGKKRDTVNGMGGNDEREQTLNQLLTEMDGFDGQKGVVILAATNRPESLDRALLRPGRFDRRIPVELPDLAGREAILKVHAKNIKMEDGVDYNAIARATAGASGAELANIVNEGALRAVKSGRSITTQEDLEEAVEVVIAGYQRKNAVISPKEKKIVAYHEIGHALVAAKQTESAPVHKITIIPRTSGALGYTMQVAEEEQFLLSKEEAFNKIVTFTGGRAAEEVVFNTFTTGASNDIEQATKLARAMVTRYGMSEEFDMMALESVANPYLGGESSLACSSVTSSKIDDEVLKIIKRAHEKAINILTENEDKLHELASYLLEKETITGDEFMKILNNEQAGSESL